MKWWYWLLLELLIIFGVMAWIYFFPSKIEGDFAKGMIGFVLIYAIEELKRKKEEETERIVEETKKNVLKKLKTKTKRTNITAHNRAVFISLL